MATRSLTSYLIALTLLVQLAFGLSLSCESWARASFRSVPARAPAVKSTSKGSTRRKSHPARRANGPHRVTQYLGSKRHVVVVGVHRGRYRHLRRVAAAPKFRYAYPLDFFLLRAPDFDHSALPAELAEAINGSFNLGTADTYPTRSLVRSGLVQHYPMRGGIFWRREPIKYIVVHSTECGTPMDGKRIIDSWSSAGRRHAGAQYVVDRDGAIYQAVDPDLGTVHVNIFKTRPGINNDNSIGIEMVHNGRQNYPAVQRTQVLRLVTYLQERYKIPSDNIITHRYAQQGDHTDPVNFDWDGFLSEQSLFRTQALASKMSQITGESQKWPEGNWLPASTYLQIHERLPWPPAAESWNTSTPNTQTGDQVSAASELTVSNPAAEPTVSTPAAEPTVSTPATEPTVPNPATEPAVSNPAAEPTVSTPAAEPTVSNPAAEPAVSNPAAEPTNSNPVAEPTVSTPAAEPTNSNPVAEPAVPNPAAEPIGHGSQPDERSQSESLAPVEKVSGAASSDSEEKSSLPESAKKPRPDKAGQAAVSTGSKQSHARGKFLGLFGHSQPAAALRGPIEVDPRTATLLNDEKPGRPPAQQASSDGVVHQVKPTKKARNEAKSSTPPGTDHQEDIEFFIH